MTPVFGHGRLRLYLLRLLDESPRHGYEIIQRLSERFAGLYTPSAGTIYPRLARLETEGLVRHETQSGRKVYHITDAGRAELAAKAVELDSLDAEIHDSARDLADGIAEEVRETARTVSEDLANAARAARKDTPSGTGDEPFPFGPFPFAGFPFGDASRWDKNQWREWKQQQREQARQWRADWRRGQPDPRQMWKDQWAQQWKDHWAQQANQWSEGAWAWWTGSQANPDPEAKNDWRDLMRDLGNQTRSIVEAAREHSPLSDEQIRQIRAVLEQAVTDVRRIIHPPSDEFGDDRPG